MKSLSIDNCTFIINETESPSKSLYIKNIENINLNYLKFSNFYSYYGGAIYLY